MSAKQILTTLMMVLALIVVGSTSHGRRYA